MICGGAGDGRRRREGEHGGRWWWVREVVVRAVPFVEAASADGDSSKLNGALYKP
jgi:hypothetical protein